MEKKPDKRTFAGEVYSFFQYANTKAEAKSDAEAFKARSKRRGRPFNYRIAKGKDSRPHRRGQNRYSVWTRAANR